MPKKLRNIMISEELEENYPSYYDEIPYTLFKAFDSVFSVYGMSLPDKRVYIKGLSEISIYKNRRKLTTPGSQAPDFILQDSTGRTFKLEKFKGQVLYLDVWASWCKPCIAEFPEHKDLVNEFKDQKDLQFISVSIDNLKADWKKLGLQKHNPSGLQLWAGRGGWTSAFSKAYWLRSIPKYIILDRNGYILDFDAPRPSAKEIKGILKSALEP